GQTENAPETLLPTRDWRETCLGAAAAVLGLAGMALAGGLALAQGAAPEGWRYGDPAILQGLDKVTARISTFQAPVGQPVRFGTLRITVRTCYKRPPEETPESAAFMEVHEVRPNEAPAQMFVGWMFASSPALSAIEHAVYDVWVIDCVTG
ncbi:MAG: DUF2155 domain-containing protein, partial [Kiloniellales bacterium]